MPEEWIKELYTLPRMKDDFLYCSFISEDIIQYIPHLLQRCSSLDQLHNKKLIIFSENGYGDCIWIYYYIKKLPKVVDITIVVPPLIKTLLDEDIKNENIQNIRVHTDFLPYLLDYDYFMWSFDLLHFFEPYATDKYLNIPYESIKTDKLRVGLALGNTDTEEGMLYRNVPREYSKYFKAPNIELYNFCNYNSSYINIRHQCHSFLNTAKILQTMDYLITADNVMLHLAGALGVKTYAIFTHDYEPIWTDLNEENVGWYKTVKPFICEEQDNWKHIIEEVSKLVKSFTV